MLDTSHINKVKTPQHLKTPRSHRFMMSASASSYAMLMAGTMSVPRSMAKIKTVDNGIGVRKTIQHKKGEISGMFDVSV